MAHNILSSALVGIDAVPISVQIDSSPGLHSFTIVGLGDKAVQESIDRIEAAVKHSGFVPPRSKNKRFIVNLSPADLKKEGPGYDLPIAIAYLLETGQIKADTSGIVFLGELSLDGTLTHTNGVLAATTLAREAGAKAIVVPIGTTQEANLVPGVTILGAKTLTEVTDHLSGTGARLAPVPGDTGANVAPGTDDSFAFIRGQHAAKRALVISAAGGHNLLMNGTPGSGKTLLARSIMGILPPLTRPELIEVTKIHSAAGLLRRSANNVVRPFFAPHHTSSPVSVIGGGSTIRPGQVSLAHRGVLFLDEMPEFARNVLEALRQPLEDGIVTVSRASGTLTLPAKFMLIGAMNPCPCGAAGDAALICSCSPHAVTKYMKRISGPLLDRMDLQVFVSREGVQGDSSGADSDGFLKAQQLVAAARDVQRHRFGDSGVVTNGEISHKHIARYCALTPPAERLLRDVVNRRRLSLRAYHKAQKVARTIADMEGVAVIDEAHIAEALTLRIGDRAGTFS